MNEIFVFEYIFSFQKIVKDGRPPTRSGGLFHDVLEEDMDFWLPMEILYLRMIPSQWRLCLSSPTRRRRR